MSTSIGTSASGPVIVFSGGIKSDFVASESVVSGGNDFRDPSGDACSDSTAVTDDIVEMMDNSAAVAADVVDPMDRSVDGAVDDGGPG